MLSFCSEWYDPASLLMNDEASIMLGHLVGLNCIDANLCMKEYDLDNMVSRVFRFFTIFEIKNAWGRM